MKEDSDNAMNGSSDCSIPKSLRERPIDWDGDSQGIRLLFGTTWKGHPVLNEQYYNWQFLEKPRAKGIGYYASSSDNPEMCAGVYAVIPTDILVEDRVVRFSTSLYTMTHPDYYKRGIFKMLAKKTYEECAKNGIYGTIGVPNSNSLPGFTNKLGFRVLGQLKVLARIAGLSTMSSNEIQLRHIATERELLSFTTQLDLLKARSGIILAERSIEFIRWRFFRCPGVQYRVTFALDSSESVRGILVVRSARKRGVPITVVVDFLVDETFVDVNSVAAALFCEMQRQAWRNLSPLIITLVNPNCFEAGLFLRHDFRELPSIILPHNSSFIIRLHKNISDRIAGKVMDFKNWYFSFADYDIF